MAIIIDTQPLNYGRVYDTNRLNFKISSDNFTETNFRFYIEVYYKDVVGSTFEKVATVRKRPLTAGYCYFNPAEIWSNYLTYDLELNISGLTEAVNSNGIFRITITEEYGNPPTTKPATSTSSNEIMLYNGIQQYIPYDLTAYSTGNTQWVMSGTTYPFGWWNKGVWVNDTSAGNGKIVFDPTEPVGGDIVISGLTSVYVSYTDRNGNDATYGINMITAGDYVKFEASKNANEYFIISFGDQVSTPTYTIWSDITYYEKGSAMNMTGFTLNDDVEILGANTDITDGYGKFLTDAYDFQVDTYDYSNLYFVSARQDRPTHARVRVHYWNNGIETIATGGGGNNLDTARYLQNPGVLINQLNTDQSAPNPVYSTTQVTSGNLPVIKPFISSYYTGYTLTYNYVYNEMYYIPTGPMELNSLGIFDRLVSSGYTWVFYSIDLTDGLLSSSMVYNQYPIYYYRKSKCERYNPIQLFWLNPHGGFDRYTFYKKNYISYDIERIIWSHRFSDTYTLGERGKTVSHTNYTQKIELNTDLLSASEAQTLAQLELSPEVYGIYEYLGNVFKIPFIVNDTKFDYKEKKNEKEVFMKINISPAWNPVSQTS
jgi:hypothetical protein